MTDTYRHTPDMGEISGFGGGYESCCQDMLEAGVKWLKEHANGTAPDLQAMEKAVMDAAKGEATGAMHHAIMSRLAYIAKNGWESYCAEVRKHEREGADPQ